MWDSIPQPKQFLIEIWTKPGSVYAKNNLLSGTGPTKYSEITLLEEL